MVKKPSIFLFLALLPLAFGLPSLGRAAPNPRAIFPIFSNQGPHATVPNHHAALFKFLNPEGDPVAVRIGLIDAFLGIPVELAPGEDAYSTVGWSMFIVEDCEDQVVRQVVDFESAQCQIPDPETEDPETVLDAIAALPEECLAAPAEDPCAVFQEAMRYDFATSIKSARDILNDEISQSFALDGSPLPPDRDAIHVFKYLLAANPDIPPLVCSEEFQNSPLFAYLAYGYQIPPQTGQCIIKGSGVLLPTLSPGEHEFHFLLSVGGEAFDFPPVTIIQN